MRCLQKQQHGVWFFFGVAGLTAPDGAASPNKSSGLPLPSPPAPSPEALMVDSVGHTRKRTVAAEARSRQGAATDGCNGGKVGRVLRTA